jgi:putative hydrolase of the HAD superfamily
MLMGLRFYYYGPAPMTLRALLFDVGGVVMRSSWALIDGLEPVLGVTFPPGRGPFDPAGDPLWRRLADGEITEVEYWDVIAPEVGFASGLDLLRAMMVEAPEEVLYWPAARQLMADARAAGLKVGILSNDLVRFGGEEWLATQTLLLEVDALCDATRAGVRKPHPRAYLVAAEALALAPEEILFLDDAEYCVAGALAVGMEAIRVDETAVEHTFAEARRRTGLPSAG